jgi:hypothetical protein
MKMRLSTVYLIFLCSSFCLHAVVDVKLDLNSVQSAVDGFKREYTRDASVEVKGRYLKEASDRLDAYEKKLDKLSAKEKVGALSDEERLLKSALEKAVMQNRFLLTENNFLDYFNKGIIDQASLVARENAAAILSSNNLGTDYTDNLAKNIEEVESSLLADRVAAIDTSGVLQSSPPVTASDGADLRRKISGLVDSELSSVEQQIGELQQKETISENDFARDLENVRLHVKAVEKAISDGNDKMDPLRASGDDSLAINTQKTSLESQQLSFIGKVKDFLNRGLQLVLKRMSAISKQIISKLGVKREGGSLSNDLTEERLFITMLEFENRSLEVVARSYIETYQAAGQLLEQSKGVINRWREVVNSVVKSVGSPLFNSSEVIKGLATDYKAGVDELITSLENNENKIAIDMVLVDELYARINEVVSRYFDPSSGTFESQYKQRLDADFDASNEKKLYHLLLTPDVVAKLPDIFGNDFVTRYQQNPDSVTEQELASFLMADQSRMTTIADTWRTLYPQESNRLDLLMQYLGHADGRMTYTKFLDGTSNDLGYSDSAVRDQNKLLLQRLDALRNSLAFTQIALSSQKALNPNVTKIAELLTQIAKTGIIPDQIDI